MRLRLAISLLGLSAFAGQSLSTASGSYAQNASVPNIGAAFARIEGRIDNWAGSESGYVVLDHAYGPALYISCGASCALQVYTYHASVPGGSAMVAFQMPTSAKVLYFRIQQTISGGNATYIIEAWDYAGNGVPAWNTAPYAPFLQKTWPYNSDSSTGLLIGNVTAQVAFYRVASTPVAAGSRPPQASDSADLANYKFDGNANDSASGRCGGPCNLSATGSPTYVSTTNAGLYAAISVSGAPPWTRTPTLRAGVANTLAADQTMSQADSAVTLSCVWSVLSGSASLTGGNTCTPAITPSAFGEYSIQLQVTDSLSNVSTVSATLGAVVMDSSGVITPPSQDVTDLFGPQIGWGRNPWGYADWLAEMMSDGRYAVYTAAPYNISPTWPYLPLTTTQAGTVSWSWTSGSNVTLTGTGTAFQATLCSGSTPIANRQVILHFSWTYSSDAIIEANIVSCASNTSATINIPYDPSGYGIAGGTTFSGVSYSYADNLPQMYSQGQYGGLNFYGEDLANWQLYYRTGRSKFRQRAQMLGDWLARPRAKCQGSILFCGGTGWGAVVDALLSDSGHGISWSDIRPWAQQGRDTVTALGTDCAITDSRNIGWQVLWFALAAWKDPDTSSTAAPGGIPWRTYWRNALSSLYTAEAACAGASYSFASSGDRWNPGYPQIAMTNGSNTGTGTSLPTTLPNSGALCSGIAAPSTGTATNGSATVVSTGANFSTNTRIAVSGSKSGNPYTEWHYYTVVDTTHITFDGGATWQGDTGAVTWMIDSSEWPTVFGRSTADAALSRSWSCYRQDASTIKLMRNWSSTWDGPTGSPYVLYSYNVAGIAQQPYMLGIRLAALRAARGAALAAGNTTLAANLLTLISGAGGWGHDVGFETTITGGTPYYARVQEICEPPSASSMTQTVCFSGTKPPGSETSIVAAEEQIPEFYPAIEAYGDSRSWDSAALAYGDTAYGNLFGVAGLTTSGYAMHPLGYSETSTQAAGWTQYQAGKYFGMIFGAGRPGSYPAQRAMALAAVPHSNSRSVGGKTLYGGKVQ